jgi:hypothetical protein
MPGRQDDQGGRPKLDNCGDREFRIPSHIH